MARNVKQFARNHKRALILTLIILSVVSVTQLFHNQEKGKVVEQTRTSKTVLIGTDKNGNEKYQTEISLVPQYFQDKDGNWKTYNTQLVGSKKQGFDYSIKSADFDTSFKSQATAQSPVSITKYNATLSMNPGTLQYVNDNGETQKIADPDPNVRGDTKDNTITYKNLYGQEIDLKFTTTSTQIMKELVIKNKDALPMPTIKNPRLELSMEIETPANTRLMLNDPTNPFGPKVPLDSLCKPQSATGSDQSEDQESADTCQAQIVNTVEFQDDNSANKDRNYDNRVNDQDKTLFGFVPATARDSSALENSISSAIDGNTHTDKLTFTLSKSRVTKQSPITSKVAVPYTWLENAQYPIFIDPTVSLQTPTVSDDGYWAEGNSTLANSSTSYYVGGSFDTTAFKIMNGYTRFTNVQIPTGSTITNAILRFTSNGNYSSNTVNAKISAVAADNPSAPTTYSGAEDATRTTASVNWDSIGAWTTDNTYDSPDISNVIQEIINRSGWAQGNAMLVYTEDNGSTATASNYRRGYSVDGDPAKAPQLIVQYVKVRPGTPIAYWKFDDGQGSTAQDSSGRNYTGTISGATWENEDMCHDGKCLKFDGTNDYVSRADDNKFDFSSSDDFTISSWIRKSKDMSTTSDILISKASDQLGSAYIGYKIYMDPSGDLCFNVKAASQAEDTACTSGVDFDDRNWYHVTAVKTGTTKIELFVNGQLRASDTSLASTGTLENSGNFYIGIDNDAASRAWDGYIDEVKVFNYALSVAQIKADYNTSVAVLGTQDTDSLSRGLVGYWKLNESSANSCTGGVNDSCDSTGENNDMAWNGNATSANGKFGNSVSFDGTGDYLSDTSISISETRLEAVTVCAWVYLNSLGTTSDVDDSAIFSESQSDPHVLLWYNVNAAGSGDRTYSFSIFDTNTSNRINGTAHAAVAGQWQHVCGVSDGTSRYLYLDGTLNASRTDAENISTLINGSSIRIGSWSGTSNMDMNGKIDEVRLYNRALSAQEIAKIYNHAPGPVVSYTFEEASGISISDNSGNGNTATLAGSGNQWINGKYGKALSFNGTTGYISANDNSALQLQSMTLSSWVKINPSTGWRAIIAKDAGVSTPRNYWLGLSDGSTGYGAEGALAFFADSGGVTNGATAIGTTAIDDGTWHYVSATLQDGTIKLYVDGVLQTTASYSGTISTGTQSLKLGGDTYPLNGALDEVRIYNYARSPKQIVQEMNGGHAAGGSPVGSQVGYWKFDEGFGNTANNSGNHGSPLNGSITSATWTNDGKMKKALSFNGTSSYVSLGDFYDQESDSYTLSAWIKPTSTLTTASTSQLIFDKTAANSNYEFGWSTWSSSKGLCFYTYKSPTNYNVCYSTTLTAGTWYHVVVTHNQTSATIYLNGQQVATGPISIVANTTALQIGRRAVGDRYFDGTIDEVKVYNYALTADEVKIDYNAGKALTLGVLGTDASGNPSNSLDRSYCPPGDTTATCSPIAYWNFEQTASNDVTDFSGNNNTGSFEGSTAPRFKPGKIGTAGNFNGSDEFVYVSDLNNAIDGISALSVSAWVNNTAPANSAPIARKGYTGGSKWEFKFGGSSTGGSDDIDFIIENGASTAECYSTSDLIAANTWTHVAVSYDGTQSSNTTKVRLYINGTSQALTCTGTVPSTLSSNDDYVELGKNSTKYWTGLMDEVRIYNYARTPAQIAWDYNRGKPLAYWKLDECTGTSANDSSGNGNTGTISIGGSGTQTSAGDCNTASTAWGNGKTGKRNYSLNFDGLSDYVSFSQTPSIQSIAGAGSISLWIYQPSISGTPGTVVSINPSGGSSQSIEIDTAFTQIDFSLGNNSISSGVSGFSASSWTHVAATWDTTGRKLYVNGKQVATSGTTPTISIGSGTSYFGGDGTAFPNFTGQIDDVQIFNYALTQQQVRNVMNGGAVSWTPATGAP